MNVKRVNTPSISLLTVPCARTVVVLCCLFWCQNFGGVSPNVCSYYFSSVLIAHLLGNSCSLG